MMIPDGSPSPCLTWSNTRPDWRVPKPLCRRFESFRGRLILIREQGNRAVDDVHRSNRRPLIRAETLARLGRPRDEPGSGAPNHSCVYRATRGAVRRWRRAPRLVAGRPDWPHLRGRDQPSAEHLGVAIFDGIPRGPCADGRRRPPDRSGRNGWAQDVADVVGGAVGGVECASAVDELT